MAGIVYEGTNLVGAPFKPYVDQQISRRQKILGNPNKTNKEIIQQNGNTAWIRLASSVNIENSVTYTNNTKGPEIFQSVGANIPVKEIAYIPNELKNITVTQGDEGTRRVKLLELGGDPAQYFGNTLAKYLVLFNGTSYQNTSANLDNEGNILGGPSPLLKEGVGWGKGGIYDNSAYGFMGTEFGFTAMPGLLDATITSRNMGSLREATVNIRANSKEQFKLIDNLYCRIGYSMFLEWGNGIYFNNKGEYIRTGADDGVVTLIYEFLEPSFTGINKCPTDFIKKIEEKREMSNGNYDAIFARVANFSWEFTPEGYYLITLKLISWGDIIESLGVDASYGDVEFDPTSEGTFVQPNNSSALSTFINIAAEPDTSTTSVYSPSLTGGQPSFGGLPKFETTKNTGVTKRTLQANITDKGFKTSLAGIDLPYTSDPSTLRNQTQSDYNVDLNYDRSLTNSVNKIISANATFNENTYFYVRFGDLLDFIKERLLIYETVCGKPIIDIETSDKNYCYYSGINLSADPSKVMVGVNLPFNLGVLAGLKDSIIDQTGQPAWKGSINQESVFVSPQEVAIEPFATTIPGTEVVVGNIMNIYFEATFLTTTLERKRDKKTKKVSLFNFLNALIEEANSCLGGINKLDIRIVDDQTLQIYDQVPIYNTQSPDPTTIINLYGVQLNNGSFVKQFSIKTELSNEFATTVSIGAQSNGNVVGEDATMLSKWNFGLVDRFYPGKVDSMRKPDKNKKEITPEENINKLVQKLKFLWLGYADGKIAEVTRTKYLAGVTQRVVNNNAYYFQYFDTKRFSEFVKAQQDYLQELIKLRSEEQKTLSNQIGMLPINISTTMQGISGIRIYDQYPVDVRFIPNYYPQYLKFIIKGVNHVLKDNIWETNIETIAVPKLVKDLKLKEGPIIFTQDELLGGEIKQITREGNTGSGPYTQSPLAKRLELLGRNNGNLQFKDVALVGRAGERIRSLSQGVKSIPNSGEVYSIKLSYSDNLALNNWPPNQSGLLKSDFSRLYWLAIPAQNALQKLAKQATDEGIVFTINSTYRSYPYQENIKRQYPKQSARPGLSPHGWGGAIDILELNTAVGKSTGAEVNKVQRQINPLYRWLAANAPKYGWINPKYLADGKTSKGTSGGDEIWHWEWWGTQGLDKLTK